MNDTAGRLEQGCKPDTGKVRLLSFDQLDGRTRAVTRVRNAEKQLEADLGGNLTSAQHSLARRASVLSAILEDAETKWAGGDEFPFDEYLAATNVLRRLLSTLGVERRAKPIGGLPVLLGDQE